ncbi:hypothetical protein D3C86_2266390 [compost metagenome]
MYMMFLRPHLSPSHATGSVTTNSMNEAIVMASRMSCGLMLIGSPVAYEVANVVAR